VSYLLDTDVCIGMLRRTRPDTAARIDAAIERRETVAISAVSVFELAQGAAKSGRGSVVWRELDTFLSLFTVLAFEPDDARLAGEVEWGLRRAGRPIGSYDVLIGSHALARDLTLVTGNVRELARIDGLRLENWLA
jgi:tRNA(fMet)-specific endonuclease VapC